MEKNGENKWVSKQWRTFNGKQMTFEHTLEEEGKLNRKYYKRKMSVL